MVKTYLKGDCLWNRKSGSQDRSNLSAAFFWQLVVKAKECGLVFSYVYMDPCHFGLQRDEQSSTSDVIANVVDGLLENDKYET